jgi:F420-non-reducing hydrogenase iron-sulfur subunit
MSTQTPVAPAPVEGTGVAEATVAAQAAPFEPVIIGFTCNWCSYRAADLAGTARTKYPPNVRLIRLMCSGRLDPTFVLKAFAEGADAVMVSGCHPGECHYIEQNYKAMRRFQLLKRTIEALGIEPERLQLVWASAAEGVRLAGEIARVTEEVRAIGPLNWPAGDIVDVEGVDLEKAWEATGGDPDASPSDADGPPEAAGDVNPDHAAASQPAATAQPAAEAAR